MKIPKLPAGAGQGVGIAIVIGAGALAVYWLTKQAASAVSDVNKGTPYEGGGLLGTLGNGLDALSGRTLSTAGGSLGSWLYDVSHPWEGMTQKEIAAAKQARATAVRAQAAATGNPLAAWAVTAWDWFN